MTNIDARLGRVEPSTEQRRDVVKNAFFNTRGLLSICSDGGFSVAQGRSSGIKVSLKESWDDPLLMHSTTHLLHEMVGTDTVHTVVGIESGGSPYATLLSNRLPAKLRLFRKKETDVNNVLAGATNSYVGNVLVVDDVLGRGDSLLRTLGRVSSIASETTFLSIFSYGSETRLQSELGIRVKSLFQVEELISMIVDEKDKSEAQEQLEIYQEKIGII